MTEQELDELADRFITENNLSARGSFVEDKAKKAFKSGYAAAQKNIFNAIQGPLSILPN